MQRLLGKRLQTQLLVWTALILVISVTGLFEIRMYLNLSNLEQNLRDRSETTLTAVEKALSVGMPGVDVTALGGRLYDFAEADRTVDRLDIVERTPSGVRILASSDTTPEPVVQSIPSVLTSNTRESNGRRDMITIHPVANTDLAIVAVMSFEFVDRYEALNRVRDPVFEVVLITLVIGLLNLMYKRAVSSRFDELLSGIQRAQQGDLAMIPDTREDEIGVIARTLNNLLTQVRSFNDELKREVANATESLNQRNSELEEITRQVVAMQRQLLQAERLATVGQMAATFAHEIGSPMSSLSVHVQLLLEDPALTEEQRETLEVVREQIKAMIQIVNDLLRTARRGPSDFVPTDVNDALRTVVRLVQPKLKSQRVRVDSRYEVVPSVRAYPLYLQEAFLNLINNASDAMPDGGVLSIRTTFEESTERVQVVISDTGRGIEPAVVEHLFEKFVTTKAMGEGTGLGLGIVKEILTGHRGTIQISAGKTGGTEVYITLPADTGVGVLRDRTVMEAERKV